MFVEAVKLQSAKIRPPSFFREAGEIAFIVESDPLTIVQHIIDVEVIRNQNLGIEYDKDVSLKLIVGASYDCLSALNEPLKAKSILSLAATIFGSDFVRYQSAQITSFLVTNDVLVEEEATPFLDFVDKALPIGPDTNITDNNFKNDRLTARQEYDLICQNRKRFKILVPEK